MAPSPASALEAQDPSSTDRPRHPVIPEDDPVWQALLRAPVVEETPEEREILEEALAMPGDFVDGSVVTDWIEQRRRECESAGE